jgi:hypothetical protein
MTDLLGVLDSLARVQLAAKRAGCTIRGVHGAPSGLRELVAFCGLADALVVEPGRKPIEREKRLRVEEERALRDPPA